jgi:formylglycine-generating enzyme required for sulfatase activity
LKGPGFPVVLMLLDGQPAPGLPFVRQLHWIVSADPASEKDVARLIDAAAGADTRPGELWRFTAPYRGLSAMEEKDAEYFFGRERETAEVLGVLASEPARLPVLLGNSGVGKSSLAQAGVLAALRRQAWPARASPACAWPAAFKASRGWCFLSLKPGTEPLKTLVDTFLRAWQLDPTRPAWAERRAEWVGALLGGTLRDLLDATERRMEQLQQAPPPAFLVYVDQGEELYVRAEEHQRRRFSELLAQALGDPRLRVFMSLRSDFLGGLQSDEPLFNARCQVDVPPLREAELREVVSRPAELLAAHFETDHLAADIARRAAEESVKDTGALPLLSYLLDDMWTQMVRRGDGILRLPTAAMELGGVLAERANAFVLQHPQWEAALQRLLTLKLATVREDGEPTRRRAPRSEVTDEEWRLVTELADHPNRLLVTVMPQGGEAYAEVAHEAIFRRWQKLREWIAAEREFLAWRSGLEAACRSWQATADRLKPDALLMGLALAQAQSWLAKRPEGIPQPERAFILLSQKVAQRRRRRVLALVGVPAFGLLAGLVGWLNEPYLNERWRWFVTIRPYMLAQFRPYVLSLAREQAQKPKDLFRECAKDCPEMVVITAGEFTMGSPTTERRRNTREGPQHKVVFAKPFAVSRFEVTFDEWGACVAYGECDPSVSDYGWGRGQQPVINVTWDDARRFVAWLSRMTGKPYRLLTEAEWEYAARAGTTTAYSWGDEIGKNNANCNGCGSRWDNLRPAPAGSFPANEFGLHDMHGNVWEWIEDCYRGNYDGAPADGSAWTTAGDCTRRVARGGSWNNVPVFIRSANRDWFPSDRRSESLGFRVARTLTP